MKKSWTQLLVGFFLLYLVWRLFESFEGLDDRDHSDSACDPACGGHGHCAEKGAGAFCKCNSGYFRSSALGKGRSGGPCVPRSSWGKQWYSEHKSAKYDKDHIGDYHAHPLNDSDNLEKCTPFTPKKDLKTMNVSDLRQKALDFCPPKHGPRSRLRTRHASHACERNVNAAAEGDNPKKALLALIDTELSQILSHDDEYRKQQGGESKMVLLRNKLLSKGKKAILALTPEELKEFGVSANAIDAILHEIKVRSASSSSKVPLCFHDRIVHSDDSTFKEDGVHPTYPPDSRSPGHSHVISDNHIETLDMDDIPCRKHTADPEDRQNDHHDEGYHHPLAYEDHPPHPVNSGDDNGQKHCEFHHKSAADERTGWGKGWYGELSGG